MPSPAVFGSGQIGFKSENAWASAATVDKFVGFLTEGVKAEQAYLKDESIRGGRRTLVFQKRGSKTVAGPINMVLPNVTLATLLKHMFGTISSTGAGPFVHTASPGTLIDLGLTIQKGMPDSAGTVVPHTFTGCKFTDWEISAAIDQYVMLNLGVVGKDETTATALAVAAYASGYNPFTFVEASAEIPSGAAYAVNGFSLKAQNSLKTDRKKLGTRVIAQPYDNGRMDYQIGFNIDYTLTEYARIVAGTLLAVKLKFDNADGGGTDTLVITCNGRFTGDAPVMGGPDAVTFDYNFGIESATSDANAITAVLTNADASAA